MPTPRSTIKLALRAKGRARREALTDQARHQEAHPAGHNGPIPIADYVIVSVASLTPAPRRIRKHDQKQLRGLETAVRRFGFNGALLITGGREVVDGHLLLQVAINLGMTRVPCLVIDHLSPEEVRAHRISINRLQETGVWDLPVVKIEWGELVDLGVSSVGLGWTEPELELFLQNEEPDREEEGPLEPDPQLPPVCRAGQMWALGKNFIACADARDPRVYEALFEGARLARVCLTDVPFNVKIKGHVSGGDHREFAMASGEMSQQGFTEFNGHWMAAVLAWLIKGGLLMTFIDWRSVADVIKVGQSLGLDLLNINVWAKTNAGMGSLWRSQHEMLPVLKKPGAPHVNNVELGRHGRWRSNLWTYPGASSMGSDAREGLKLHPTVKPTAMLEDALLDITNRGDVVIDPFLGSGSTLIAAQNTGRECRAIEIDPLYVDVAIRRWMAVTGKEPVLVRDDIFDGSAGGGGDGRRLLRLSGPRAPAALSGEEG